MNQPVQWNVTRVLITAQMDYDPYKSRLFTQINSDSHQVPGKWLPP